MKKFLSVALISSFIFANTINTALKQGSFKGDFALHYEKYNFKNIQNTGYGMYSVGLRYKTKTYNNFELNLGFRSNDKLYEYQSGDYDNSTQALLHTANITYLGNNFNLVFGRKKETLQWIHGFQEEIASVIHNGNYIFTLLHTFRHARANNNEELKPFNRINNKNGLNVISLSSSINNIKGKIYFYNAPNLANWYGTSLTAANNNCILKIVYSKSNELTNKANGSYFNAETDFKTSPATLNIGYIKTGKTGGLGSMTLDRNVYDNMNPLEEGNHVFDKDAKTLYASSTYSVNEKLSFTANLGHIKFQDKKANEMDFYIDYTFNKNLSAEICLDKYNSDIKTEDASAFKTQISYNF